MEPDDFRAFARGWFADNAPKDWGPYLDRASAAESKEFYREWLLTLSTVGFHAPHVAKEWGGGGYSVADQAVIYHEWRRAWAPSLEPYVVSLHHLPATMMGAGTPEQCEEFIRDALSGTYWCQGFSEPDAGSDLASLRTRAVRDGDDFVVTGQKIWSSNAHYAKWCLLLARTDPDAPKHKGISYFIMDMESPGVEVRPIRQSTGHAEFNEIFLDEVRIPAHRLIGAENNGWLLSQGTLSAERGPYANEIIEEIAVGLRLLCDQVDAELGPDTSTTGPLDAHRAALARLIARQEGLFSLGLDTLEALEQGAQRGDLASVIKVASSDVLRELTEFGSRYADVAGLKEGPGSYRGYFSGAWTHDYMNSWRWSIASGTNEIQRNIIAERVLGLPREVR